ncbi:MAG: hypothetical protein ACREEM_15845 [Blastocatellia bacterium]
MKTYDYPRILLPESFDERSAFEISMKGWLSAQVESEGGERYPVYFSDPVRLQQDLDDEMRRGGCCFAEPGLIVLPEVTVEAAQNAVRFLWREGFFKHIRAIQDDGSEATEDLFAPTFTAPIDQSRSGTTTTD